MKLGARAVEPDEIGVFGLRTLRDVEHGVAVRNVELVIAVDVHHRGIAKSPAQQRERRLKSFRIGDITREHQHVDAGWVERVHKGAPTVPVKLEVQVG